MSTILCSCVTTETNYQKSVIMEDGRFCDFSCVKCLGTGKLRPIVKTLFPLKEGPKWGVIKWYSTTKQYGFIWLYGLIDSVPDVFFHYSDIIIDKSNYTKDGDFTFQPGDMVRFDMVVNDGKLYGVNVKYYVEGV